MLLATLPPKLADKNVWRISQYKNILISHQRHAQLLTGTKNPAPIRSYLCYPLRVND